MSQDWTNWSQLAEAYNEFVGSPSDRLRTEVLYPQLLSLIGTVHNQAVLDIGAGNGYLANLLAKQGAHVKAFDNEAMVAIAKRHFDHPNIRYQTHDASLRFPYTDHTFDIVNASMVLMDMENISNLLTESHRVLKKTGKAYFSILHPCFTPPVGRFRRGLWGRIKKQWAYFHLNNYLTPPARSTKHLLGKNAPSTHYYPRTLSEYSTLFKQADWQISRLFEPQPSSDFIAQYPQFYHASKIAIFLIFELKKL